MDLFDLGDYFGSYVPVQARVHSLLKHATCSLAAKQLGRACRQKSIVGGICSKQARMELYDDPSENWEIVGATHYDKALRLLRNIMGQDSKDMNMGATASSREQLVSADRNDCASESHALSQRRHTAWARSDEVVAATAILCIYEFLSATGIGWSQHLNGIKSLLDITQESMIPLDWPPSNYQSARRSPSKARKAVFWNFARQDYLAACEYPTHSALTSRSLYV